MNIIWNIKSIFSQCFTDDMNSEEDLPADLETFPTLERCLNAVDNHTGFNIELKYPQELMVCQVICCLFTSLSKDNLL